MSSTFSTVVNCSVLDALHKLEKIQLLADEDAHNFQQEKQTIHFPRTRFMNAFNERQTKMYPEMVRFDVPVSIDSVNEVL